MEKAPPKPTDLALWIHQRNIGSVTVVQEQLTVDSTRSYVELQETQPLGGRRIGKVKKIRVETFESVVDFDLSWCSIVKLKPYIEEECEVWLAYEKENKKELAEYKRLKKIYNT